MSGQFNFLQQQGTRSPQMAEQWWLWDGDAVLVLLEDGEQGQAGCSGWVQRERGAVV